MEGAEVVGEKGDGGEVSGELRVWKCVEKWEEQLSKSLERAMA
jgi:hypothetical protein